MIFMKIMSMSNPGYKKADLALGDFEGTINPNYYLSGYPLLMRRAKSYQPSRMLVMMSWIWDTTISWIQA